MITGTHVCCCSLAGTEACRRCMQAKGWIAQNWELPTYHWQKKIKKITIIEEEVIPYEQGHYFTGTPSVYCSTTR